MRYLITGGGTGGHIYPALAICKGLIEADKSATIMYVGTRKGLEAELVPREGIPFSVIDAAGIMGKSPMQAVRGAFRATKGVLEAISIIRRFRPHVALGTGGYVSGPVILAASLLGVPCAIQEQNAVPGFTNRLLSRLVSSVFIPFPGTEAYFPVPRKCILTGNPVRPEILSADPVEGARALGLSPDKKTVFIFGGSRGARRIVEVALEMIERRMIPGDIQVLLVTGREYETSVRERLQKLGIDTSGAGNLILRPYLFNIEHALAASHLIVGRAGGMTVSEVLARGLPSILIPSPNVANNHQMYNARAASSTGGAILMREEELSASRLSELIKEIFSYPERLAIMANRAKQAGRPCATRQIVHHLRSIAERGR